MRILSCAQVTNPRAVGSWFSYDDLVRLVQHAIDTPIPGFSIVYGVSDNERTRLIIQVLDTLDFVQRIMPRNSLKRFILILYR